MSLLEAHNYVKVSDHGDSIERGKGKLEERKEKDLIKNIIAF